MAMSSVRSAILLCAFCGIAGAAALVPIPGPASPLPMAGLEANRGQANPEILFQDRLNGMAMTAQSILFSPLGVRMTFAGSNPNPILRLDDPLPGAVNSFTGASTQAWVTGIPRFASARLRGFTPESTHNT